MAQVIIDINRNPGQAQAVFSPSPIDVATGDQISWRNNDPRPSLDPLNPEPDPQAHWPAPVGGADTDWMPTRIPGMPPGFDPPMSDGVVNFKIPRVPNNPPPGTPPNKQEFQYRDATGNTAAIGIIRVWNPAPPTPPAAPILA